MIGQLPLIVGWDGYIRPENIPSASVWGAAVSDDARSSEESGMLRVRGTAECGTPSPPSYYRLQGGNRHYNNIK